MSVFLMNYMSGGNKTYNIGFNLTNCAISGETPTTIKKELTVQFTTDVGYEISQDIITVTNATIDSFDILTKTLVIKKPKADVTVTINAIEVNYLCFTANTANSTLSLRRSDSSAPNISLLYSTDKSTWNSYTVGNTLTLTNVGDKVYFKGINNAISNFSGSQYHYFVMSGSIAGSGNIATIFDVVGNLLNLEGRGCLAYLFKDCSALTTAPKLPFIKFYGSVYAAMFLNCTNLVTPPKLPATEISVYCYEFMFQNCTSLNSIPMLPATTLKTDCYKLMFFGCSSIKMSETQEGEYVNTYTFGGTPSSDYAEYMFAGTGGTFTGTPTQQTYYTSNEIIIGNIVNKGDIINMTLGNSEGNRYRVLSCIGDIAKVASMYYTSTTSNGAGNTYVSTGVDTMLNSTWYNTLSSDAKQAIVPTTVTLDSWSSGSSTAPYFSYYDAYYAATRYIGNKTSGSSITRNVIAFSLTDIWEYYNMTSGAVLDIDEFLNMLDFSNGHPWLSTLYSNSSFSWCIYDEVASGNKPHLSAISTTANMNSIPVFTIDLSKISYTKE